MIPLLLTSTPERKQRDKREERLTNINKEVQRHGEPQKDQFYKPQAEEVTAMKHPDVSVLRFYRNDSLLLQFFLRHDVRSYNKARQLVPFSRRKPVWVKDDHTERSHSLSRHDCMKRWKKREGQQPLENQTRDVWDPEQCVIIPKFNDTTQNQS